MVDFKQTFINMNITFDALLIIKLLIVLYIILSTFYDFNKNLVFIDNKLSKIIILLLIIVIMYFDIHLGILLIVAFFLVILQLNNTTLQDIYNKKHIENFVSSLSSLPYSENKEVVECDNKNKNQINDNILNYTVDDKVKPYEVFVKMLTTQEQLENAANAGILDNSI